MRHDVRDSACCLVRRQCLRKSRIHDGEFRAYKVAVCRALQHALFFCHDDVRAAFASGCRDRKDSSDRKGLFYGFSAEEIPEVAVIDRACSCGLCRIYYAAAADGEYEVDPLFFDKIDSLIYKSVTRIRLYSAEFLERNAFFIESCLYSVEQAGALYAAAAVEDKDLASAELLYQLSRSVFSVLTERIICR